jgi:hypothetical protein
VIEGLGPWTGGITPVKQEQPRGQFRVTVWFEGIAVGHRNFVFETLADGWAEKMRKQYKEQKALGVFVKKERTP